MRRAAIRTGARRRARRRGRRGDRRFAPSGAPRDRNSQGDPRRPLELHPRTRPDRLPIPRSRRPESPAGCSTCSKSSRASRHVAEAMLGHVMVADDLHSALAASNLNGHGTVFVTRDGDLVAPGRMIAGGSVAASGRRRRIGATRLTLRRWKRLRARVEQAESEAASLRAAFEGARAVLETAYRELNEARDNLARAERAMGERRNAVERVEREVTAHARPARADPRALGGNLPAFRRIQRAARRTRPRRSGGARARCPRFAPR